MNHERLLGYLDINSPEEFQYFEDLADLIECDATIESDAVYKLFREIDGDLLSRLLQNYFDEVLETVPSEETELYTILDMVERSLIGMIKNADEEEDYVLFSESFCDFRNWYSMDSKVECIRERDSARVVVCLRDALTLVRLEKLGEEEYIYDFEQCLSYRPDTYAVNFSDLISDEEVEALEEAEESGILEEKEERFIPERGSD